EFNPDAVASARAAGLPIEDRSPAALETPAETIVAFQVLEHLGDPATFIAECRDKLAPRGWLVLAVPNDDGAMGPLPGDFLNLPPPPRGARASPPAQKADSAFGAGARRLPRPPARPPPPPPLPNARSPPRRLARRQDAEPAAPLRDRTRHATRLRRRLRAY